MTPRITRDKLKALHGGTARFYATWLSEGLAAYEEGELGRDSFPGAANYVGWMASIEDDLALIYQALAPKEKTEFRLGIALALGELERDGAHWLPVATALLRLATLVKAPVLGAIPSLVAAASEIGSEESEELCELAVDAAIELAPSTPEALDALQQVVTSPGFSTAVAGTALLALVRADPTKFAGHLQTLRTALANQYGPDRLGQEDACTEEDRDALLRSLASVPPAALARGFDPGARGALFSSGWSALDWFCRGLMESRDPEVEALAKQVLESAEQLVPLPAPPTPPPLSRADPFLWALGPPLCPAG